MGDVRQAYLLRTSALASIFLAGIHTSATAQAENESTAAPVPVENLQSSDGQSPAPSQVDEETRLGQVIVTARRRDESIQEVPVAITAFSGSEVRDQNIGAPTDLMAKVPSLQVTSQGPTSNTAVYVIRGLGQSFGGSAPSVVTYYADVPTPVTGYGFFYDLANIQVLKGPQGTLFGRNTTGGAILVSPQKPTNDFGGYATATVGSYSLGRFEGAVNLPLVTDRLAARVAVDVNRRNGYTQDVLAGIDLDDRNYSSGRLSLLFTPTDRFENYLVADYLDINDHGGSSVLTSVRPGGIVAAVYPQIFDVLSEQQARGPRKVTLSLDSYFDRVRTEGVINTTTLELADNLTLKNIVSHRTYRIQVTRDGDGSILPIVDYLAYPGVNQTGSSTVPSGTQVTEELQLQGTSLGGTLDWIVGGYYEDFDADDGSQDRYQLLGGNYTYVVSHRNDSSQALFSQATLDLAWLIEGLSFTAGARYTEDSRSLTEIAAGQPTNVPPTVFETSDATFDATTWTIGLDYKVNQDVMLYLASRRGYKSGGFNTRSTTMPTFAPEYLTDIEVGLKSQFSLGAADARLNAAVFRGEYSDIQQTQILNVGGDFQSVITNASEATIQGVEIEGTLLTPIGLELSGYYNYLDASYGQCILGAFDCTGQKFEKVPENKYSITGKYTIPLSGTMGDIDLSATYAWQSDIFLNLTVLNDPTNYQSAYGLVNLRADWNDFMGNPVRLSAFMTNATDETYQVWHIGTYQSFGYGSGQFGEPRMWGFQVSADF